MASSSAAASTLTRPRVAVTAVVSAVTVASVGYYVYYRYRLFQDEVELATGPPLHRSNAVRRNRHGNRQTDSDDSDEVNDENTPEAEIAARLASLGGNDGLNDEWYGEHAPPPPAEARAGENIVTLLFRVSEDNARRNAYVHRGCQCNGCGMVPIRGVRYRCANCADFDLCEVCEAQGLHNKTHIFYKIKVPAPPYGARLVQPVWYPGDPDNMAIPRTLPRNLLARWSAETGYERVELDAFWEQWTFMANTEWRDDPDNLCLAMDRKTFDRCLVPSSGYRHAAPNLIHDRMFAFYDTNKDDLIGFEEFLHGVSYRKRKDKLKHTFDGYDIDGDGYVNRRDFLRMFRAYYVLYKQMHRDILEGLDDHMMTTIEAQQLINSRAPLSGLFGREGRVPPGDHGRPMQGKVFHSNGEVDVRDGKDGVVQEDKPDTSSREEVLNGLFTRNSTQSAFRESFGSSRPLHSPNDDARYSAGIINPPQNTVELTSIISGEYSHLEDLLSSLRMNEERADADDSDSAFSENSHHAAGEENEGHTLEDAPGPSPSTPRPIPDATHITNTPPTESQLRAQHQALGASTKRLDVDRKKRVQARKQLHERWRRRQFYLDEEEGAQPPQGWNDEDDVLANLNGGAEASKSAQRARVARSRSSSKVRFAEDTDDFDIRSNPSTSSRSVPERWGGMEIPDAERDAGKEILYQVTQQAFNELLDDVFKHKENLAVQCAQTREEREKHRHLFEHIELDAPGEKKKSRPGAAASRERPDRPVADQGLVDLLAASGYTYVPEEAPATPEPAPDSDEPSAEPPRVYYDDDEFTQDDDQAVSLVPPPSTLPVEFDPTMPQFRPDSLLEAQGKPQMESGPSGATEKTDARAPEGSRADESKSRNGGDAEPTGHNIAQSTLEKWKRLDLAEQEAKERGGWGKLSYEEFEVIYKWHELDSGRNRLDYLGSWIDFCIP